MLFDPLGFIGITVCRNRWQLLIRLFLLLFSKFLHLCIQCKRHTEPAAEAAGICNHGATQPVRQLLFYTFCCTVICFLLWFFRRIFLVLLIFQKIALQLFLNFVQLA
ncbi:hypothetical protein BMF29_15790 [Comamonas kerstersii]|nr:hypothetical protein BMF29_15790 [Comamonas kerstersii]